MNDAPLVIFDIGATLVNGPSQGPAARIAAQIGLSAEQRRELRTALMTREFNSAAEVSEFIEQSFGCRGSDAVEDLWTAQESETRAVEGAAETLIQLHERGLRLALISNIWQPYLTSVRRDFGDVFDRCVAKELQLFSFRTGHAKPSTEMFERALSAANTPAANAVMVGDTYRDDIEPALGLDMAAIWVMSRPEKESQARERVQSGSAPRPSAIVESITALTDELVLETIETANERRRFANSLG